MANYKREIQPRQQRKKSEEEIPVGLARAQGRFLLRGHPSSYVSTIPELIAHSEEALRRGY